MHLIDIAFNNLWRRKSKILLLFLGIILGVATIIALTSITSAMDHEISDKFDQIGSNLVIVPRSDSLSLSYGGITINSGGQKALLKEDAIARIMTIENNREISVIAPKLLEVLETDYGSILAIGVDFEAEFFIKKWWHLAEGQVPGDENQVLLGSITAQRLNKDIGSIIMVDNQQLLVTGVLEEMGTQEDYGLYMNLSYLQSITGHEGNLSYIEISALCYTCPIEMIAHQISEKLPEARVTAILEAVEARKVIIDRFNIMAQVVSLIVILIGFLIVTNTVMAAINQRTKEIGVFRAIGFRRKDVLAIIFMEISLISGAGGFVGYLLGTSIAKLLAPVIAQMEIGIYTDGKLGLAAVVLTIIVGISASIFPTIKAISKDPAHSLSYF